MFELKIGFVKFEILKKMLGFTVTVVLPVLTFYSEYRTPRHC